jgi:hypothetical protein
MIWQKPALKSMRAEGMSNIITSKSNERGASPLACSANF